ncbi:MAG: indole-3-glycerol phosphate synthase TrpC [Desulfobacterales bacterium]|jgi:indole-3-glycerol phosphate synthase|nr:indole-3-glycerol phosphate synthase TrpC [Desulfobacteraceae bacterium]MBT4365618.1 indole-3-glycerol phosphate synthase TrpC [Desulfobacteraceae bacterium]MBT7086513.1 indole-3-glycerol phosphate synthase TrpC [Desulfobacterales bacterium]MBT7696702.1 indole-3-glycerol phosphate synthase TrpC [Desulfobacterales bacterium]
MVNDFLKTIVDHKKEEVANVQNLIPENRLREEAENRKNIRPFFDTLKEPGPSGINIISEIKRASPSKGDICTNLDPALLANEYEQGGAAAMSVLTDEKFFKGSPEDFITARKAVNLPMLRKDFIVSSYQIYESAALEADAVLLIVRILSKIQLKSYLSLIRELKMDALVEIHSEEDLEFAANAGARLVGINNRNLSSFETDISTSTRLVSMFEPGMIPVAASGISSKDDILKNLDAGIFNFLIGESLVRAENTKSFLKLLLA